MDLLLSCHERIRMFAQMAVQLAEPGLVATPEAVAGSAAQVHRYFLEALPLHAEDEDRSVAPRLRDAPGLAVPLARMTAEHAELDARLAVLLPAWAQVAAAPAQRSLLVARRAEAAALEQVFLSHLAAEESLIFPVLARHLTPELLRSLRAEIRARRR